MSHCVEQQTKKRMQLTIGRTKLAGDVIIGMTQVQVSLDTEPMTVMMVRIVVDRKCADGGYRVRSC
jgi:ketosteroid isomerase-like protein